MLAYNQKKAIFALKITTKTHYNMAKPIKETPVLVGEEALRFAAKIDNPRTVSSEEVKAARQSYESVMAIAKFNF